MLQRRLSLHSRHKGQVLPLTMMFLLVICASVVYMFNSIQLVQEKIRLTNATDGALYAGGIRTARIFNMIAHCNRASIMQHTNIAQTSSLASWVKFAQTLTENIIPAIEDRQKELRRIPKYGEAMAMTMEPQRIYFKLLKEGVNLRTPMGYSQYLQAALQQHNLGLQMQDSIQHGHTEGWSQAETGAKHGGGETDRGGRMLIMRHIIRWNYDDKGEMSDEEEARYIAHMDTEYLEDNFDKFVYDYTTRAERTRLGKLARIDTFTDEFTKKRSWTMFIPFLGMIKKCGGTEIVNDADGWSAMDNAMLIGAPTKAVGYANAYTNKYVKDKKLAYGCSSGNGAAYNKSFETQPSGWDPPPEPTTEMAGAASGDLQPKKYNGTSVANENADSVPYGMVHPFQDLSAEMLAEADPIVKTTAMAWRWVRNTRTSAGDSPMNSNSVKPAGRLELYEGNTRDNKEAEMQAVASYEVFYQKDRKDKASLFEPYWHARLVEVTDSMRRAAQTHRDTGSGIVTP